MPSVQSTPRFAAAISTNAESLQAADQVCREALAQLGTQPNLAMLFVSPHHAEQLAEISEHICSAIGTENLLGCTGESIIGGAREIEEEPAVSLWLASLPDTVLT